MRFLGAIFLLQVAWGVEEAVDRFSERLYEAC